LNGLRILKEDTAATDERASLDFFYTTEPEHLWLQPIAHLRCHIVIEVQHGKIVGRLILKHAGLCRGVILHRTVTVEVVRCDVENYGDLRTEGLNRFQLEARNLEHHPSLWR